MVCSMRSVPEAPPALTVHAWGRGVGWVCGAISRGRLTFAGLAAGAGQWEGRRAAWFRAGHEAAVDLALLTDRANGSWEMSSDEDQPLPWEHMALRSPLRWEREGAAEWCGQGPANSEEGSSVPSHSHSRP